MFQGSQITRTKAKSDCRFIIYGFTSRSRIHLLSIAGEGLQNLGLCSALKAFEQGEIFIMPHLRFSGLIRRTAPFCRIALRGESIYRYIDTYRYLPTRRYTIQMQVDISI
jgi:hypothetical protein